jgi:two-component system sensor histidine kinase KdpD
LDRQTPPLTGENESLSETSRSALVAYAWATGGVAAATLLFHLVSGELDKGQAPLLYLPVVIVCAVRLGFGPAVLAAAGSFICWNFFFLPPFGTWAVQDPKDWLSLIVFLMVAVATARLAAQARTQTQEAQARAEEARVLQQASEQISVEVETERILPALTQQLVAACSVTFCALYRAPASEETDLTVAAVVPDDSMIAKTDLSSDISYLRQSYTQKKTFGFSAETSAASDPICPPPVGVYVPLIADGQCRGVVHVGPRLDGRPFSRPQERLILALANNAAIAIARQSLRDAAAQAQALREADELKSTLLSLVSHELRTPLASIKASASGLLQDKSAWNEAALEEALVAIDEESDRLGGLVCKLLDLSRLEAGAWKPQWDWCDLVDVLGTALARLPVRESARVHVVAPPDLPLVRADFVQIAQVLTNLLENALKYSPPKSDVTVRLRGAGNDLRVDVVDSGSGIPPEEASAVFERFHRLEQHRRSGLPGTGLGLAICRGIIEAHGGCIWEQDAPDGGAVFSFTLPRATRFSPQRRDDESTDSDTEVIGAARTHLSG